MYQTLLAAALFAVSGVSRVYAAPQCTSIGVPPVLTADAISCDPIFETRNGPRTLEELRSELGAAGYGGPWDTAEMLAAYARAGVSGVLPYSSDTAWTCLAANPSCGRDPWWAEWNELQGEDVVTYAAIGGRFSTERRFVEAVNLLWQWPHGKTLLLQADRSGVRVMSLAYDRRTAFASYVPERKLIAINQRF